MIQCFYSVRVELEKQYQIPKGISVIEGEIKAVKPIEVVCINHRYLYATSPERAIYVSPGRRPPFCQAEVRWGERRLTADKSWDAVLRQHQL